MNDQKLISILAILSFSSCATIEVYQVGRQTIMEEEAQGEWPRFEEKWAKKKVLKQAQFFPDELDSKRKKKVLSFLNGEFINQ